MIIKSYKGYKIYFFKDEKVDFEKIGKKIIDKKYKIEDIYKNTIRNYVVKVNIDKSNYILKSPKSENIIPQRRFFSIFKKGEALNTLINTKRAEDEGIEDFVKIYLAIVKRRLFIEKSYILMEYIDGERIKVNRDIDQIMEIVKKIHKAQIYHGDLNTSNFVKTHNKIKIIDSQVKREHLFYFKRWYDIFTFKEDLLVQYLGYDVEKEYNFLNKSISYYVVKCIKKIKKSKIMLKIKEIKKDLRKKGYKI